MTSRLNPYVSFDGNAREALEFYREVLGGDLTVNTYGEYGDQESSGAGEITHGKLEADKVMHGMLETPMGFTLMAADNPPGMEYRPGNTIAVSLSGDDAEALRSYWERLSEGGTVTVPLEKQMWGDEFGMCIDRFGTAWMVNILQPQS
jgi:PhnB protein